MIYWMNNAQRCKNGSHYEASMLFCFFFYCSGLWRSLSWDEKRAKDATVWIRAFIKQFKNTLVHSQPPTTSYAHSDFPKIHILSPLLLRLILARNMRLRHRHTHWLFFLMQTTSITGWAMLMSLHRKAFIRIHNNNIRPFTLALNLAAQPVTILWWWYGLAYF